MATYVYADLLARRSGASPWAGGRVILKELRALAARRTSFAFETSLASRSFAPWINRLVREGWTFHLVFLWLPSPDLAVARVGDRVRHGGHAVPEDVVRRRYPAGLRSFFGLYRPLAMTWSKYDKPQLHPEGSLVTSMGSVVAIQGIGQGRAIAIDTDFKCVVLDTRGPSLMYDGRWEQP